MNKLMTVEEFAKYFRTTTTTVYRWLKQGKIKGVKIGKEWRLNEDAIQAMLTESESVSTQHQNVWEQLNTNEHLMAVTQSQQQVYELEASFFRYALEHGKHMMKGCWWQDPDEIEEIYGTYGLDVKEMYKDGLFKIIDFNRLYKKYGIRGPVESWRSEIARNRRNSLWASGSPSFKSCETGNHLLNFEKELNEAIKEMPIIGICPYSVEEFGGKNYSHLNTLFHEHSGILFYEQNHSTLLRHAVN